MGNIIVLTFVFFYLFVSSLHPTVVDVLLLYNCKYFLVCECDFFQLVLTFILYYVKKWDTTVLCDGRHMKNWNIRLICCCCCWSVSWFFIRIYFRWLHCMTYSDMIKCMHRKCVCVIGNVLWFSPCLCDLAKINI